MQSSHHRIPHQRRFPPKQGILLVSSGLRLRRSGRVRASASSRHHLRPHHHKHYPRFAGIQLLHTRHRLSSNSHSNRLRALRVETVHKPVCCASRWAATAMDRMHLTATFSLSMSSRRTRQPTGTALATKPTLTRRRCGRVRTRRHRARCRIRIRLASGIITLPRAGERGMLCHDHR